MKEQSAAGILGTTIDKIKDMVDSRTIIGDPIDAGNGIKVIPVSKVTYGFASGGTDFPTKSSKDLFGGGGGAGVTLTPVAFLVINNLYKILNLIAFTQLFGNKVFKVLILIIIILIT